MSPKLNKPIRRPWMPEPAGKQGGRSFKTDFYNKTPWRKLRLAYITANPLCVLCEAKGIVREATCVDHIKQYSKYPELGLEWSNLRSLCNSCHSSVSGRQRHQ